MIRTLLNILLITTLFFGIGACKEGNSMGISASKLDTRPYFPDAKVAAFVADVQDGNLKRVTEALRAGMDPNALGKEGFRPIFFAFAAHTPEVVRALLASGADPNARLTNGSPPLYYAVRLENSEFTKALLDAKADPNARAEFDEPIIHEAVMSRQPAQLELLAGAGADINVVWGSGTPLYGAIGAMSWDVAHTLLDLGADPHWRSRGGHEYTAGESLCNLFMRPNFPIRVTRDGFKSLAALFDAFARRGVVLTCAKDLEKYVDYSAR